MDLDVLSWNCRGICSDTTTRALKDLISQNKPQIIFLCETKISREEDFVRLKRALGFANAEVVLSTGRSGGLALYWSDEVKPRLGTTSAHHMDAVVGGSKGYPSWRFTGFYGYACTADRDKSWQLLQDLADLDSLPWVIIGDFNEILNNREKIDGPFRPERQMREFRYALGYRELLDMGYYRGMATWGNCETLLRLDRAVCTSSWFDLFFHAKVFHLPQSNSDHILILLKASTTQLSSRLKEYRFHFEEFWLQHEGCDDVVAEAWNEEVLGVPMYCLVQKFKHIRLRLSKWQRETFRGRQIQMMIVRSRLEELMSLPLPAASQEEKKGLHNRLQDILYQEEVFWKQRAKVQWLKEGDRNTKYFHKMAESWKRKKALQGLFDVNGNWQEEDDGVAELVTDYFIEMFTASELDYEAVNQTLEAISPCVTSDMNHLLLSSYSGE